MHFPGVTRARLRSGKGEYSLHSAISQCPLYVSKAKWVCWAFAGSRRWHSWGMLSTFQFGDVGGRELTCLEGGLAIKT